MSSERNSFVKTPHDAFAKSPHGARVTTVFTPLPPKEVITTSVHITGFSKPLTWFAQSNGAPLRYAGGTLDDGGHTRGGISMDKDFNVYKAHTGGSPAHDVWKFAQNGALLWEVGGFATVVNVAADSGDNPWVVGADGPEDGFRASLWKLDKTTGITLQTIDTGMLIALDVAHSKIDNGVVVCGTAENTSGPRPGKSSDNLKKYNSAGILLWSVLAPGPRIGTTVTRGKSGHAVAVSPLTGDVYVAGDVTLIYDGPSAPPTENLAANVFCYTIDGAFKWSAEVHFPDDREGPGVHSGNALPGIELDPGGNVYVIADYGVPDGPTVFKLDKDDGAILDSWRSGFRQNAMIATDLDGNVYTTEVGAINIGILKKWAATTYLLLWESVSVSTFAIHPSSIATRPLMA